MGTCKEDSQEQQEVHQGPMVEENFTSGPPASRTVIDNLKKLLVQRQHSRESDYENKNTVARSTSGSNSDTAFFSQFSTSSSESDSDSDSYLIFEDISNQENRKSNGCRRRHRRQRSYSSSSSSSRSPVEKRRRKPARMKKSLTGTEDHGCTSGSKATHEPNNDSCTKAASMEEDSANSTSSHKDSSSDADDENIAVGTADGAGLNTSSSSRHPKFKSRRDRNRKRKRSETNYANNRPNIRNSSAGNPSSLVPTIVISHTDNDVNNDLSPIPQQHPTQNVEIQAAATSGSPTIGEETTALQTTDQKPDENNTKLQ